MPISKKIIKELKKMELDKKKYDLVMKILEHEDSGVYNYKKPFEQLVNQYISSTEKKNRGIADD